MVSTPGDGSCGIGTYARDLLAGMEDAAAETVHIPQRDRSLVAFLSLAVRAVRADGDVIHVQHEYGLFRRDDSRYPGVFGLVFFPLLFALARLRGQDVVVTLHSVLKPTPDEAPFRVRLYLMVMHKLLATGAGHLVFLSGECEERFREDVALEPWEYTVLPHGVNTPTPVDVSQAEAKRQLGYRPEDMVVAIPGFVRPPKGHDVFVEVARRLPEHEFLIAGGARPEGDDFAFAQEIEASAPENVTITGVLDDEEFWRALAAPDIALLPYRVVTQSGTFNYCATMELPVLANDVPYFAGIEDEWGTPETVDASDPDAVANRVATLLADDARRQRLRHNIRAYKRANSFERVGADHRRIYRHVRAGTVRELGERAERRSHPLPSASGNGACSAQRPAVTD